MKKLMSLSSVVVFMTLLLVSSCTSYKKVPYMRNSDEVNLEASALLYEARIMPKDEMTITVSLPGGVEDRNAVLPFNLTIPSQRTGGDRALTTTSQEALQTYLVRNDGTIDFPVLGTLKVAGMTAHELEALIASKLEGVYLKKHPVVTVRLSNYQISVLGEVNSPGTYTVSSEKVSIYGALSLAKDMTVYGRRDNVKLIREDSNGKKTIYELDLNDAGIINSPYYYLQQNDVIYVTPNKTKARNSEIGSSTSIWISVIGILTSVASLVVNIVR